MATALSSTRALQASSRQLPCRRFKAFSSTSRKLVTRVVAEDAASSATPAPYVRVPALTYPSNNEGFKEVFAINGPASERIQGRLAMIGFVAGAAAEASSQQPILEQFAGSWFSVVFVSLLIGLGSLMPKFTSGVTLKELHDTATSEALKGGEGVYQYLTLFNANTELWTGRIAMLGLSGLVALEMAQGDAFF